MLLLARDYCRPPNGSRLKNSRADEGVTFARAASVTLDGSLDPAIRRGLVSPIEGFFDGSRGGLVVDKSIFTYAEPCGLEDRCLERIDKMVGWRRGGDR